MQNFVRFGLIDYLAKPDSQPSSSDIKAFVNINELSETITEFPRVATFERDLWKLDGSVRFREDNDKFGYWSNSMSLSDGTFATNPKLTINFSINVETSGLILRFDNAVEELNIKWTKDETTVDEILIEGNEDKVITLQKEEVEIYNKLEITFLKTKEPYRYIKLYDIEYGMVKVIPEDEIVSGTVINDMNLVSSELTISTLDLTVYSDDAEFNLLNPTGLYLLLKDNQPFEVYQNGELYSVFYLKDWSTIDNNNYSFNCEDAIGVMASVDFLGGMYTNKNAKDLVTEICDRAGFVVDFQSDNINGATVTGWIPSTDCRKALQDVLFACKCVATTHKSRDVVIKDLGANEEVKRIGVSDIYVGEKLRLRPLVTEVRLTEHRFLSSASAEQVNIYDDSLSVGETIIPVPEPHFGYSVVSGAGVTITEQNANYIKVNREFGSDNCVISARKYTHTKKILSKALSKYVKSNIVKVDDAYLINSSNSVDILDHLFDFYKQRIEMTLAFDKQSLSLGDNVDIETVFGEDKNCVFETLELDIVSQDTRGVALVYEPE